MRTYIALLAYNHYDLTLKRLYELMRHCRFDIDCVYVINNGSTDGTHEGLNWWTSPENTGLTVKEIELEQNLGFTLGANSGLQEIAKQVDSDSMIFLLSNDVQITGNFIPEVTEQANRLALFGGKYLYHDTGWNKFGDRLFPYLEGWMLAATAGMWNALGFFDQRYAPHDYEDVDLSTKALDLGLELVEVGHGKLFHQGGGTLGYTPERLEQTNRNKKKFEEKWINSPK